MTIAEANINSLQSYADLHYDGKLTKLGTDAKPSNDPNLFGGDGLGFDDIIDAVNPLHHIPVVSSVYRAVTGDVISTAARLTGGGLFGGVLGLAGVAANAVLENQTGSDIGEQVLSLLDGEAESAEDLAQGFNHILSHKLVVNQNVEAFAQPVTVPQIASIKTQDSEQTASIKQGLAIYRNASIQLNENKQTQLQENLTKIAINMKS